MQLTTFPLHGVVEGRCACGKSDCNVPGKHPAYPYSQLGPGEQIPFHDGYGICTGSRSGIVVLDIDVREDKNGLDSLAALGPVPNTLTVVTPTGGFHLYFTAPDFLVKNSAGKLGPGIDVRGEGGFVVGPGSPHRNGGTYEVLEEGMEILPMPEWLVEKLRAEPAKPPAAVEDFPRVQIESEEGKRRYQLAGEWLAAADPCMCGNSVCQKRMWLACWQLVGVYELDEYTALTLLKNIYIPRGTHEWSDKEIIHNLRNAAQAVINASFPRGPAPEGWIERMRNAAVPEEIQEQITEEYSYAMGKTSAGKKGKTYLSEVLSTLLTAPAWENVFRYDEFTKDVKAFKPPMQLDAETVRLSDKDVTRVRLWFETETNSIVSEPAAFSCIVEAATVKAFHPIRDWLQSLPPSSGLLDGLATRAFGAKTSIENQFLVKGLISAVRRIINPGCQVDTTIVLCGPQGALKSSVIRELFGKQYVRSQMPDLSEKDASDALLGFWAVELAELDRIVRAKNSHTVKEFLTRTYDDYRPSYGRNQVRHARQCIFWGTTNDAEFLEDATGGRRFWPISIDVIDIDYIRENRDAIWAEAYARALTNEPHWLESEEEANEHREAYSIERAYEEDVLDYACGKEFLPSAKQVYVDVVLKGDNRATVDDRQVKHVIGILTKLKFKPVRKKIEGKTIRSWQVPENIKSLQPSSEELKRRHTKIQAKKLSVN